MRIYERNVMASLLKVSGGSPGGVNLIGLLRRGLLSRRQLLPLFIAVWAPLCDGAQAPDLMWTTNVGARVFAVDNQTNVYANAGGSVMVEQAGPEFCAAAA